jgi:hypothetical protein
MQSLANAAAKIAMTAAADVLALRGVTEPDIDALTYALRAQVKADIGQALNDAKEALEANMGAAAEATFAASMRISGIRAVETVYGKK